MNKGRLYVMSFQARTQKGWSGSTDGLGGLWAQMAWGTDAWGHSWSGGTDGLGGTVPHWIAFFKISFFTPAALI